MHTVGQLIMNQTAAPFLEPLGSIGKPHGAKRWQGAQKALLEKLNISSCVSELAMYGSSYKGYFMNLNNKNLYNYTCTNLHNTFGGNKEQVSNGELNALKCSASLIVNQEREAWVYVMSPWYWRVLIFLNKASMG